MHDARLRDLRSFGRCQWARRLRRLARFLDAETDRRRNESSGRLRWRRWRCNRCGSGRRRRLFDCLLDNRWFFDWHDWLGNDHNRGQFLDDNRGWWFDFDNGWWRNDSSRGLDRLMLDDRRRRRWCNGNRGRRCGLGRRCRRLDCLDEARRAEDWCRRLGWFGLLRRRCFLRCGGLGWNGVLGEHVAARKRDVPLSREPFDERACDNFLDCARGALQLDSVIALEEGQHFLARRAE